MELYFRERGDASLPPLIILHGLWGASDNWLGVAGLLEDRYHVFLPDMPGHGHSPRMPLTDYGRTAAAVKAWLDGLGLSCRPFVAGHSMGGKVLMRLLLDHPGTVAKGAVIDILPKDYGELGEHGRLLHLAQRLHPEEYRERRELHAAVRQAAGCETQAQILLKNLERKGMGFVWKVDLGAVAAALGSISGWEEAETVCTEEVLFVRGGDSPYVPEDEACLLERNFPSARIRTVEGCGHWIHAFRPRQLAVLLADFFRP